MFGINGIPITGQYLGSMKSQILNLFDDLLCVGFQITLNLMTPNSGYIPYSFHVISVLGIPSIPNTDQYLRSMEQKWIPKPDLICRYAVCFIHSQLDDSIIEIIWCCVSKILKVTSTDSTDLGNQCFKTWSWFSLTTVKSLLLNSALLEIRIPAQPLIVHMQVQC